MTYYKWATLPVLHYLNVVGSGNLLYCFPANYYAVPAVTSKRSSGDMGCFNVYVMQTAQLGFTLSGAASDLSSLNCQLLPIRSC